MSLGRICARCQAPLPDDAAEDALCATCDMEVQGTMVAPDDLALPEPISPPAPAFTLPPAQPEFTTIGDFEIISKLGQGGMGAVYRARQISLDRVVALKVLPQQFEEDEDYVARFQREAAVAARLSHPNLVRVFTSGQADGCHFIAMELIEGENLRQRMKREPVTRSDALRICADVARALQCGWDTARLIHRDIKPANIYLSRSGEVKLGDLGLAKSALANTTGITQTGTSLGTPLYMSPEQGKGEKNIDFRADIYSLGCTLYELLTGRPPYEGRDGHTLIHQHIHSPLPPIAKALPGAPMPLVRLVGKMLKKTPRERHTDYADLIAEMDWVREQIDFPAASATSVPMMATRRQSGQIALPSTEPVGQAPRLPVTSPTTPAGEVPALQPRRKVALWLALAAGVLVLGAAAWFLTRPAAQRVTGVPLVTVRTTSATPVPQTPAAPSIVPYPTVAADGTVTCPVGVWTRLLTAEEEAKQIPRRDGEWMLANRVHVVPTRTFTHCGLRVRFRGQRIKETAMPQILLRGSGTGSLNLTSDETGKQLLLRDFTPGSPIGQLASVWLDKQLRAPSREYNMEFYAIGSKLIGRLDGQTITSQLPSPVRAGSAGIYNADNDYFRDAHFINLDGLPEAEALKLVGVDQAAVGQAPRLPTGAPAPPAGGAPALQGSTPATATKDAPFINSLGMKFVPVPITGGPTDGKRVLFSVWETRVQDYGVFSKDTGAEWIKADFPQGALDPKVNVRWDDAQAFCAWLTERERKAGKIAANERYRLPSDHEWSCAVGIGEREDAAKLPAELGQRIKDVFPWGNGWPPPPGTGNFGGEELKEAFAAGKHAYIKIKDTIPGYRDGYVETAPVGSFPASSLGLHDLAGNATEWCEDWFDAAHTARACRSRGWTASGRNDMLSSNRINFPPDTRNNGLGFRVVLAPAP